MDLNELRQQINSIDDELLTLFTRRMDLASQVADYKREHDLPILQPAAESGRPLLVIAEDVDS